QAIGVQLDDAGDAGVELWRQHEMEIATQLVRRHRLQIKMQRVTAIEASRLRQLLIGVQPGDFDLRQCADVIGQNVDAQRTLDRFAQANRYLLASEEALPLSQIQYAIYELTLLRRESTSVQFPAHPHGKIRFDLGWQP